MPSARDTQSDTGMRGLAPQADELRGQQRGLRAAVDSGRMVLDEDAAERLAKVWEDKADELSSKVINVDQYIARGAYGDCRIGRAMDTKMADKIEHPEAGAVALMVKMEKIMRQTATTIRDAARTTRATDEDNARDLERNL
ncbi:hypothetical protein [Actinopolyspora mortivallis]|uniref:hypothetical protein n=1 Tax=Actinopolyspora mortivallis TaxID=33906 RepID=UPI001B7F97AD|nr:hypothetical protein [Actinopolyspora mortivallis]